MCDCETVAERLLNMLGSPSPDTNKRLFINTTYWEFLNETIPVRMSRGDEWGGSFVAFCFQFKSRVQPKKRPLMGNIKQS